MLARIAVPLALLSLLIAFANPAHAWTHRINNWDNDPNDYTCGYSVYVPCIYWPEPNHVSSTQYASIDPSLASLGPAHYNMTAAVNSAIGYWNAITRAFNPYIYDCESPGCVRAIHYFASNMNGDLYTLAYTDWNDYGDVQFANGQYYAFQNSTTTYFNTSVTWNSTLTFSGYHVTPVQADGRKVATHETDHVEGLGHTARSNAVMKQGATPFYTPQTDDINGIRAIYTGYIPS